MDADEKHMVLDRLDYESYLQCGVSEVVARFITANEHPIENMDIFVLPIGSGGEWDYNVPDDVTDVVGMWDQGLSGDAYARWVRNGQTEYVHLSHDDPEHFVVAWTEQSMLAVLASQYHEFLHWDDVAEDHRKFLEFANYIGFRYANEVRAWYENDDEYSSEDFEAKFGRLK